MEMSLACAAPEGIAAGGPGVEPTGATVLVGMAAGAGPWIDVPPATEELSAVAGVEELASAVTIPTLKLTDTCAGSVDPVSLPILLDMPPESVMAGAPPPPPPAPAGVVCP